MKKLIFLVLLLFLASYTISIDLSEYWSATVKTVDATITEEITGRVKGNISERDSFELHLISFTNETGQQIIEKEEYLEIGGQRFDATQVNKDGLIYAYYKVENLERFASNPSFKVVHVTRIRKDADIALEGDYDLSSGINQFTDFKKQTEHIESNDSDLRAESINSFTSNSELQTIAEITQWVNENINYERDKYFEGRYGAKNTYNERAGVCDEFANLTAAFLRIKGIPTRYVGGLAFGETFERHGWVEAYLPGKGWIGSDSTYGEAGWVDGGHFIWGRSDDIENFVEWYWGTTYYGGEISVELDSSYPVGEVNSVEFFENIVDVDITMPNEITNYEELTIEAKITNISGSGTILPVNLIISEDFGGNYGKEIIYLANGETKTVSWDVIAPYKEEVEGRYWTYPINVETIDGNNTEYIKLVPGGSDQPPPQPPQPPQPPNNGGDNGHDPPFPPEPPINGGDNGYDPLPPPQPPPQPPQPPPEPPPDGNGDDAGEINIIAMLIELITEIIESFVEEFG